MKFMIKNRFEAIKFKHPELGDYIILCMAVKGMKYDKSLLRKAFLKLVSRDEYDFKERNEFIDYLSEI